MTEATARRIFAEELRAFRAAFPDMPAVRLVVRERHFLKRPTPRDLAWYESGAVVLLRAALDRSEGSIRGIIRHELGHAADPDVNKPGSEARADRLARQATGCPVRYTSDGVQHATHGACRRPAGLHR